MGYHCDLGKWHSTYKVDKGCSYARNMCAKRVHGLGRGVAGAQHLCVFIYAVDITCGQVMRNTDINKEEVTLPKPRRSATTSRELAMRTRKWLNRAQDPLLCSGN